VSEETKRVNKVNKEIEEIEKSEGVPRSFQNPPAVPSDPLWAYGHSPEPVSISDVIESHSGEMS
jgi:hypothetical protein